MTIEDLLRVKRAERPAAEFWTEFDRELRAKQLAALVEKRPWWRSFSVSRAVRGLTRYNLPLGAAAVLAITLVSLRDYRPAMQGPVLDVTTSADVKPAAIVPAPTTTGGSDERHANESVALTAHAPSTPAAMSLSSEATAPGELARMIPLLGADAHQNRDLRPFERSIAENRVVAEAMLGTPASGFEMRALPARTTPQEPLAQITLPSETRRHRFAAAVASASLGTSPVPTARVARRLSDEQLYDSIHRFGASGNSVSFKF